MVNDVGVAMYVHVVAHCPMKCCKAQQLAGTDGGWVFQSQLRFGELCISSDRL